MYQEEQGKGTLAVGDYVFVTESAEPDCNMLAWQYIKNNIRGQIRRVVQDKTLPAREALCAVEFQDEFAGGNDCGVACLPRRGQWITAKHLDLDFEASRNTITVPGGVYDEKESMP